MFQFFKLKRYLTHSNHQLPYSSSKEKSSRHWTTWNSLLTLSNQICIDVSNKEWELFTSLKYMRLELFQVQFIDAFMITTLTPYVACLLTWRNLVATFITLKSNPTFAIFVGKFQAPTKGIQILLELIMA
jgi:hypothetical protein